MIDHIACAHEVLHYVHKQKLKGLLFKLDYEKAFDKVNWEFLIEVLKARGFGNLFIGWIKSILLSGQTCINLNGEFGPYFKCQRGLRQGDPLSPLLFNLVADVLNKSLQQIQTAGFIRGLGNFHNIDSILNLQFTDDTLLFLHADATMVASLKLHLIAFENLSGMKINYAKSEMIPLNLSDQEGSHFAQLFGCKVTCLPITYLGLPLHYKKPSLLDWQSVIDKIDSRIQG